MDRSPWIKISLVACALALSFGWGKISIANSPAVVFVPVDPMDDIQAVRPEVVAAERPQIQPPEENDGNDGDVGTPPGNSAEEAPENSIDTNAADGGSGCSLNPIKLGNINSMSDALAFPLFAVLAFALPRVRRGAKI